MALTFPLALSDFWEAFPKESTLFRVVDNITMSGLANGQVLRGEIGPSYWEADVTFSTMSLADARACRALIASMRSGLNSFYAYDALGPYPAADPDGSILGSTSVTVSAVSGMNQLRFAGLPDNYVLSVGDYFSFTYGPDNAYRAYHQILERFVATGGSPTFYLPITPFFADAPAPGKVLSLKRAICKMAIIPGTFNPGQERQMKVSGISFKCRQVP